MKATSICPPPGANSFLSILPIPDVLRRKNGFEVADWIELSAISDRPSARDSVNGEADSRLLRASRKLNARSERRRWSSVTVAESMQSLDNLVEDAYFWGGDGEEIEVQENDAGSRRITYPGVIHQRSGPINRAGQTHLSHGSKSSPVCNERVISMDGGSQQAAIRTIN